MKLNTKFDKKALDIALYFKVSLDIAKKIGYDYVEISTL